MPADSPSAPYGDWVSYGSGEAAVLAIVLAAVAGAFAYLGTRIRSPISVRRPGRTVSGFMIAIWLLAIYTFIVALYVTGVQVRQVHLLVRTPNADFRVHVGTLLDVTLTISRGDSAGGPRSAARSSPRRPAGCSLSCRSI